MNLTAGQNKKIEHSINGKLVSEEKNITISDEEILSQSIGKTFPWKNDHGLKLEQQHPTADFSNYIKNKIKIECGHIIHRSVDLAKTTCEASGGIFEKRDSTQIHYQPEQHTSDVKIVNKINSLLKPKKSCETGHQNKHTLKNTFSCTCNGEELFVGVNQCKPKNTGLAK